MHLVRLGQEAVDNCMWTVKLFPNLVTYTKILKKKCWHIFYDTFDDKYEMEYLDFDFTQHWSYCQMISQPLERIFSFCNHVIEVTRIKEMVIKHCPCEKWKSMQTD